MIRWGKGRDTLNCSLFSYIYFDPFILIIRLKHIRVNGVIFLEYGWG